MFIPTRVQLWDTDVRAALINNYGASGLNASAVILEGPSQRRDHGKKTALIEMPAGVNTLFCSAGPTPRPCTVMYMPSGCILIDQRERHPLQTFL